MHDSARLRGCGTMLAPFAPHAALAASKLKSVLRLGVSQLLLQ